MQIKIRVLWRIKLNNPRNGWDVEPSRCHVITVMSYEEEDMSYEEEDMSYEEEDMSYEEEEDLALPRHHSNVI